MSVGMLNGPGSAGTNPYIRSGSAAKSGKTNGGSGVMKCVAAGGQKVLLCSDALMSYASPQTGESVNIYKAEDYSPENPLYRIMGLDADGNAFEQIIDASQINARNCSYNELMVLNLETGHTSDSDYLHAVAVRDKAGIDSYFTKTDYVAYAQAVMKDQKTMGNWASYLSYDKWIRSLVAYSARRNQGVLSNSNFHAAASVNGKPQYETYESAHYRIVPDSDASCFTIYNADGERLGAFSYQDIKIRQDAATGRQFLISEHGTMSYDAMALDGELKEGLQKLMGVDSLKTEKMQGFTLKTHAATGLQYLLRDGEEGAGGKVILQGPEDAAKYEALAQEYFSKYPNLIHSSQEAYIWADFEIRGLAQHTKQGILSINRDGMSYRDDQETKNNWSVRFAGDTYQTVYDWFLKNGQNMQDMQKFSVWRNIFQDIGGKSSGQPSFGTAMTREELLKSVDDQVQKNKMLYGKTTEDLIRESSPDWRTALFGFVGETKSYRYYEFVKELNSRSK